MAKIKQIKVYSNSTSSWKTGDIGADASNIDLASAINSTVTNVEDAIQYLSQNINTENKVNRIGDTMTGVLNFTDQNFPTTTPSSNYWGINNIGIKFTDSLDNRIGYLHSYINTQGEQGIQIATQKDISNTFTSTTSYNTLKLFINSSGGYGVEVTSPSAWRNALQITPANIGAVPTSRTVNGHALTGNINVTLSDLKLGMSSNMDQMGFYLTASDYPYLRWTDTSSNQYQIVLGSNKLSYQTKASGGSWVNEFSLEANHVSAKTQSGTKSLATSTDATIMNTGSLAVGKYLIVAGCAFSSNATGQRAVYFTTNSAGGDAILQGRIALPAIGQPRYQVSMLLNVNTATTYYLGVWQNSGSTLTVSAGYMNILKLNS